MCSLLMCVRAFRCGVWVAAALPPMLLLLLLLLLRPLSDVAPAAAASRHLLATGDFPSGPPPPRPCRNVQNSPTIANDVPCADDLERYQIVLWFSVGIAVVAVAAVYQLAFMSFKKDTMLYSSFNPNWEGKRR